MRWLIVLAAVATLVVPGPVRADGCADRDGIMEQIDCVTEVLEREDARLNRVWKRVMAEHPSGGDRAVHREEIRAAQRLWITFRDADCEAQSKTGIPKYWEFNRLSCLVGKTRERINTLTEVYLF